MAVPKVSYNPTGGHVGQNVIKPKAPNVARPGTPTITDPRKPTLPDFSKPNIGQTPQGNVPQISYNPSAPVAANTPPPMNSIGQGLQYGNSQPTPQPQPPTPPRPVVPPIPEPTLPPPIGNNPPQPPAPNPQPTTPVPVPSRQEETTQQRIDRLQQNPKNPHRQERLQGLRERLAAGVENPKGAGQGKAGGTGTNPEPTTGGAGVQLDDQPSTWRTGDLAELAPPRGVNTYFRDEGKSEALQARKDKIKARAGVTDTAKAKKGGGAKDVEGTTTDTSQAKKKTTGKLSDKQKKALKKRPQAGTPARPYINRGVTYNPLGAGGTLRV